MNLDRDVTAPGLPPPLHLEPEPAREWRRVRDARLNQVVIPGLRALGFVALLFIVVVHNAVVLDHVAWWRVLALGALFAVYTAATTVVLRRAYGRTGRLHLGLLFLITDLLVFDAAIYVSGGEQSWLFYVLAVRVADQTNTTTRRTLLFAHLAPLAFLVLLGWLSLVEGRPLEWGRELVKVLVLWLFGAYIVLTARGNEAIRERTRQAIRVARHMIGRLQDQARELEKARISAEAGTRAKSEFLANMSHEIRTPLNGMLGMTDLALGTELTARQREYLTIARGSGEQLLRLINDILDFSKIEAGRMDLDRVELDLRATLEQVVRPLKTRAAAKGLDLRIDYPSGLPAALRGDPGRLTQVLANLLENAIKFTDRGEVVVSVAPVFETSSHVALRFAVRDTGIGIPPQKQAEVFRAFTQVDGSITRRYGGTGLGLSICAELVRLMEGRIWLESQVGQGSTFYFTARFDRCAPESTAAAPRDVSIEEAADSALAVRAERAATPTPAPRGAPDRTLAVLLADDNAVNQKLVRLLLERRGHTVTVAENGIEVLALLDAGRTFDLVLMDIQMPEMGGLDATVAIRRRERRTGGHLPIIALTAHALQGDRERCLTAGMDGYLAKPVQAEPLLEEIERVTGARGIAPPAPAPVPAPTSGGPTPETLLERVEGDAELLREVASAFLRQTPSWLEQLRKGVEESDPAAVTRAAHALKSSVGTFDTDDTFHALARLEKMGRARDLASAAAELSAVEQGLGQLWPALDAILHPHP